MTNKDDISHQAILLCRQAEEIELENIHAMDAEDIQQMFYELQVYQIELETQKEELRRAHGQIKAGRDRYFDFYDQAPVGYCTLSEHGFILDTNLTTATLLGLPRSELVTQPLSRFIHSDDQHIYSLHRKQLLETATLQKCDLRLVKPDGDYIWAHLKLTVAQADDGVLLCRVVLSDISGRIQAEKQRETLAHKYSAVVATTRDAVLAANLDSRITVFNPGAEKLFGCTANEALGSLVMRFCPEDLLEEQAEMMRRVLDTGAVAGYESERITADGQRIPVEITLSRNTDDQGAPSGINAILRDITERKLVEDALRQSEHFIKSIIHFTQDIIVFKDKNFVFRLVNPAMCNLLGKAENEIIGKTDFDIFPYELAKKYRNDDKYVTESGQSINIEEEVSSYDGIRYVSTTKAPVLNESNACEGIVTIVRDITERKRAEEALVESEALFRGMFKDHSAAMLLIAPKTGQIVEANQAAAQYYGYPLKNMIQMNIQQLNVLSPVEITEMMDGALHKQVNIFEFRHVLADGQVRDVEVYSAPITIQNQIQLFSIIHDITERKRLEDTLRQSVARLTAAAKAAQFGIYSYNFIDGQSYYSPEFLALFGLPPNARLELDEDLVARALYPDDKLSFLLSMQTAYDPIGSGIIKHEYRIVWPDGQVRWLSLNGQTIFSGNQPTDCPIYVNGIIQDISQRKQAEEALLKVHGELERKVLVRTADLEKTNTTLAMMLDYARKTEADIQERVVSNLRVNILGIVDVLKKQQLSKSTHDLIELLEKTTQDLAHPVARNLESQLLKLTAREIQLANFIRLGKSTNSRSRFGPVVEPCN